MVRNRSCKLRVVVGLEIPLMSFEWSRVTDIAAESEVDQVRPVFLACSNWISDFNLPLANKELLLPRLLLSLILRRWMSRS